MMLADGVVLTLDVDWAPDFVIDCVAEQLVSRGVRATWFVTHASPAITRLAYYGELFELGIHPNFLPGSGHGDTSQQVLHHCMAFLPNAMSVRTHGLVQSTPLIEQILVQTPIVADVSLFLPHTPFLRPVEYRWRGRTLLRIPYYWEDDFEMERRKPCWQLRSMLDKDKGLKVFDFHPIHVYLNSGNLDPYRTLSRAVPKLTEATPEQVSSFVQEGEGTRTVFMQVVNHLAERGQSYRISDIYSSWQQSIMGSMGESKSS